jgi:prophage regulatory protein
MKSKLQIDTSQLTSEITQEVLKVIKPFLTAKETEVGNKGDIAPKTDQQPPLNDFPQFGLLRLWQILGDRRKGIPPIIPVSKSTWWAGVKTGKYPKPVKLSARCTCWRVEDIRALLARMGQP